MVDSKTLEAYALEAILTGNHAEARALIDQLLPAEAEIVRDAAIHLAGYANEVYTDGTTLTAGDQA